jgi:hypothetical protein
MKYKILSGNHNDEIVEGDELLSLLAKEHIFKILRKEDGLFLIEESCDHYFSVRLTREQLLDLADEIKALATDKATKD